jgi:hypothetical protein
MGSQWVTFQALLKIDISNAILLYLKLWNECNECKNSIFTNIKELNVIQYTITELNLIN